MAPERLSPEARLLRIIEHPEAVVRPLLNPKNSIRGLLQKVRHTAAGWLRRPESLWKAIELKWINRSVAVLCGILTLWVAGSAIREGSTFQRRFERLTQEPVDTTGLEAPPSALPSVSLQEALAQARSRNIFALPAAKSPGAAGAAAQAASEVKLVGILWSDVPQALLEDTKDTKTYLLKEGEALGTVRVKKIHEDRVTLFDEELEKEWEVR